MRRNPVVTAAEQGTMGLARRTLLFAVFAWPAVARAEASAVNERGGLAIDGYDPVAYFVDGRARHGAPAFVHDWRGARWLFASAVNRDAFAADPERYAPQYGGFCAYGMAGGYRAPIDPDAWTVSGGKLYLNYSKAIRMLWSTDVKGYVAKADANWPTVGR
jgi:hypothetical protein